MIIEYVAAITIAEAVVPTSHVSRHWRRPCPEVRRSTWKRCSPSRAHFICGGGGFAGGGGGPLSFSIGGEGGGGSFGGGAGSFSIPPVSAVPLRPSPLANAIAGVLLLGWLARRRRSPPAGSRGSPGRVARRSPEEPVGGLPRGSLDRAH